ncbi:DUF2339 domain-containing protein [uncultured Paludibaculum sp.]|uniref:DUF2339 domain-containing protein n=1 Tax=uncultured Paludibaculum sp. TaxID=1765020 RepID=UPI002AAB2D57|nr:DUF2339 domain-containing protein [uncultured Paludibaculum sp.]
MEWVFIFGLAVALWMSRRRVSHLEGLIGDLTARIYALEQMPVQTRDMTPRPVAPPLPVDTAPPNPVEMPEPPEEVPIPLWGPPRLEPDADPEPVPVYETEPEPVFAYEPGPSLADRVKKMVGDDEWESLVGGSLLNKLGAFVLVIGLVLFLGYSFTQMGPAARVAVSLGVSGALLAGGFYVERMQRYRVFAWGLLGAGWACLYATTYAMYAIDAAKIIQNPTLGALLLVAVAGAMIAHSLRYQSQTVTAVAAASAYAALALSPSKQLGVGALLPLSGALLYLADRLRWHAIGVLSVAATYGIIVAHGDQGSPLWTTQAFLLALWVIFEAFDLLQLRAEDPRPAYSALIFPLNAIGFLVLSAAKWEKADPSHLPQFLASAALLYLADSVLRGRLRANAYQYSIVLASALAALSIVRHAGGAWGSVLLGLEAELLFLAAWRWRLRFMEWLAAIVFGGALLRMFVTITDASAQVTWGGLTFHNWTPAALLLAVVAYVNRELRTVSIPYGYVGSALVQLVLGAETPKRWLGLVWTSWTAVLLELSFWRKASDFRRQAYMAWLLAVAAVLFGVFDRFQRPAATSEWVTLLGAASLGYWMALRLWSREAKLWPSTLGAMAATTFVLIVSWTQLPDVTVAVAWMALALVLVETGFRFAHIHLRMLGHLVAGMAFGRLFFANFTNAGETGGLSHRLVTITPVSGAFLYLCRRSREDAWPWLRVHLWLATSAIAILMRFEMGHVLTVVGWSLLGLALLLVGQRFSVADWRWQSYFLAGAAAVRCVASNFDDPQSFGGLPSRLWTAGIVITALYAQEFLAPREQRPRAYFSLLGSFLLSALLYREVSGSGLTVAWGLQGVLLLAAGFPVRERVLRLTGLVLLLSCILKLFLYDLRNLETLPRILSFMALGIILLGVSWVYTRFRERVRKLL